MNIYNIIIYTNSFFNGMNKSINYIKKYLKFFYVNIIKIVKI